MERPIQDKLRGEHRSEGRQIIWRKLSFVTSAGQLTFVIEIEIEEFFKALDDADGNPIQNMITKIKNCNKIMKPVPLLTENGALACALKTRKK